MSKFIQELTLYVPSVIALNFVTITQHCFNISQSYLWNADIVPCDEFLSSAQLKSLVVTYIKSLWSGLKSKVLRFRPFNLRLFFLSSGKLPEAGYEVLFILIGVISSAKLASFSPSAVSLLILLTEDSVTHWQYLCQVLIIQWNFSVSCYQIQNLTRFQSNTLLGWPTALFRLHNLLHSQIYTLAIILFFIYRLLSHW